MSSFSVSDHVTDDGVRVILAGGDVDFDVAPLLKRCIVHRIDQGDRQLVVDLSDASFFDSTAIGVLVAALRGLSEVGGSLAVVCPNGDLHDIFEIVGLENVIPIYTSRKDALAFASLALAF